MRPLLVLRPEPGASATARRAFALGLHPVLAPLFAVRAVPWTPPQATAFDAVLFTSANAPFHAGPNLARYRHLPAYAVGTATAASARDAGFHDVTTGARDAEQLLAAIDPGVRMLHLCGEHRRALTRTLHQFPVYVSQAVAALPLAARDAMLGGAVAMLHSPRAAALFAMLVEPADRGTIAAVAISIAAAGAAGPGWRSLDSAPAPTDAAMLAIARILCENDAP